MMLNSAICRSNINRMYGRILTFKVTACTSYINTKNHTSVVHLLALVTFQGE